MITGSTYLLRGEPALVTCQWNGTKNPDLPRLRALLPLVSTRPNAPRNVMIQRADGSCDVRTFRGLRKPPEPEAAWTQPVQGDCGDGYGDQRPVETVTVTGGAL